MNALHALFAAALFLPASLSAQSVSLFPERDNTLYETSSGERSNGAGSRVFAGRNGLNERRRAIMSFDVAGAIPAGAVITSATFEATEATTSQPITITYSLHRATQDWGEGLTVAPGGQGNGTPANPGDVTWDSTFFGTSAWTNAGGDFELAASANASWTLTGSATQSMSSAGLAQDVQGWLDDPATNFGWILKSDEIAFSQGSAFHSRESMSPPRLLIDYVTPTTVTIAASRDNTLYDAVGEVSNGGGTRIFVGRTAGGANRRAILGFDVGGAIPMGSTITGAEIQITEIQNQGGGSAPFSVHQVSQDWGEGTSVAPGGQGGGGVANAGDVTWISNFFGSSTWTNPGGDFDAVASASQTLSFGGGGTRTMNSTPGLVSDVQDWLDNPASNFGWIIKTDEATSGDVAGYGSRESGSAPQLTISYVPAAPPVAQNNPFGTGCAAPSGGEILTLTGIGVPTLGNAGYGLQISGGAPTTLLEAVSLGFGAAAFPIPLPTGGGCEFLLDPVLLATTLVPNPSRAVSLSIPNMPGLAGVRLYFQAIQVDGSLFIAGSNGLEAVLGN